MLGKFHRVRKGMDWNNVMNKIQPVNLLLLLHKKKHLYTFHFFLFPNPNQIDMITQPHLKSFRIKIFVPSQEIAVAFKGI